MWREIEVSVGDMFMKTNQAGLTPPTRTPFPLLLMVLAHKYNTITNEATTISNRSKITPTILNHITIWLLPLWGVLVVESLVGGVDGVGVACDVGCSGVHKNNDESSDGEVSC